MRSQFEGVPVRGTPSEFSGRLDLEQVVEKLWELQQIKSGIAAKDQQLTERPESFARIDDEYQAARSETERFETRRRALDLERRGIEGELQTVQEILTKYQGQLMKVKNQQQYAAAWKEIDTTRKKIKELEDEDLRILTEIEEIDGQLKELSESHADLEASWTEAHGLWQESLSGLRDEIAGLKERATLVEGQIPEKWRRQFYRIFEQRHGVAVVAVENGACGGCRVRIRPHVDQRLKRGEVIPCEGCHRISYLKQVNS